MPIKIVYCIAENTVYAYTDRPYPLSDQTLYTEALK